MKTKPTEEKYVQSYVQVGSPTDCPRLRHVSGLRHKFGSFPLRKLQPGVERELRHGWMLPIIVEFDTLVWGRWDYYFRLIERGHLDDEPIPEIWFEDQGHPATRKMLEQCLDSIPSHGSWLTWGGTQYMEYFLDWVLYAMGHPLQTELPREPSGCAGASMRLYQLFQAEALSLFPHDYFGDLLSETKFGRGAGFYPTPHSIVSLMTQMSFDPNEDNRRKSVNDPCIGTGRFPLYASNFSLNLSGNDVLRTCQRATLVNAEFMAPWLSRGIPWLNGGDSGILSAPVAEAIARNLAMEDWDSVAVHRGDRQLLTSLLSQLPESAAIRATHDDQQTAGELTRLGIGVSHAPLTGQHERIALFPDCREAADCRAVMDAYEHLKPGGVLVSIMADWWTLCEGERFREFRTWLEPLRLAGSFELLPVDDEETSFRFRPVLVKIRKEPKK